MTGGTRITKKQGRIGRTGGTRIIEKTRNNREDCGSRKEQGVERSSTKDSYGVRS